jgi:hypothetical protein
VKPDPGTGQVEEVCGSATTTAINTDKNFMLIGIPFGLSFSVFMEHRLKGLNHFKGLGTR